MSCLRSVPLSLRISAGTSASSRPPWLAATPPHRMYNVDEQFDPPAKFFAESRIPALLNPNGDQRAAQTLRGFMSSAALGLGTRKSSFLTRRAQLSPAVSWCQQCCRFLHYDIRPPDFCRYRSKRTKNARENTCGSMRRQSPLDNLGAFGAGIIGAMAAKGVLTTALGTMNPSKATMAASVGEFHVDNVEPGKTVTQMWQNKPVFIHHWTDEELDKERQVELVSLRDPQTIEQRCLYPEWLVLIGICTHLGCVPIPGQGDYGGYFCPCHASHYDICGRVRKGPAPRNLEVPRYHFDGEGVLVVGASEPSS